MTILVITRASWSNNNNTGNTMSNFFSKMNNCRFHNLYFREEMPDNSTSQTAFHITEKQLVGSLMGKGYAGSVLSADQKNNISNNNEKKIYDTAKKCNSILLWFARDILWTIGKWKSQQLDDYIAKLSPDIIFMPAFSCYYPYKVLKYISDKSKAPTILFHADDNYTMKQFSLSPLYWVYRLILRKYVYAATERASINYVISHIQKEEYEKCFHKKCNILTKGADFSKIPNLKKFYSMPFQMVYTGNISSNRWKSLALIVSALKKINSDSVKAKLYIYTTSPLTKRMKKALCCDECSNYMGPVEANKIDEIQSIADILIHVEGFDLKSRLAVRQSFSTKLVDYFANARCVFAVGPSEVASIDYLIKNDAAIVVTNKKDIYRKIVNMVNSTDLIIEYSLKSWEYGKRNHDKNIIQTNLYNDLIKVCENNET